MGAQHTLNCLPQVKVSSVSYWQQELRAGVPIKLPRNQLMINLLQINVTKRFHDLNKDNYAINNE